MNRTSTPVRAIAFALAAVIATSVVSTVVGSMSPALDAVRHAARNPAAAPTAVAIIPSRIEVVGVRSEDTAAHAASQPARPRT